jgi:hypothetical protein
MIVLQRQARDTQVKLKQCDVCAGGGATKAGQQAQPGQEQQPRLQCAAGEFEPFVSYGFG